MKPSEFLGEPEFERLKREVEAEILRAVDNHLVRNGRCGLNRQSLVQMSVSLSDVSQELLLFGADLWPASIDERVLELAD